ncbi:MAG TPA: glycosyltransferase family 4 protein [Candidatus Norongarragalinales archaeon]|nr:glycosyltransferase family 4 protein [Candidatus Norongarragalinales archaeon]
MKKKILCVFPGDSLKAFYEKGEVKGRYYNPCDFFDEVHFITFCDSEVDPDKVKRIVGKAKIFVHPMGKLKPWSLWTDKNRVASVVERINPDAIRAFSTSAHGFMAAFAAKKLGIPFVVSLHTNPEADGRALSWRLGWWKNWLSFQYNGFFTEQFVLDSADKVICVYEFARKFALDSGVPKEKTELVYNKVYAENYAGVKPALKLLKPVVLFVGRLIPGKSPENLIRALPSIDAVLVMVGSGPLKARLDGIAGELGVNEKIIRFPSIPNKDLPAYFKSASVFALPIDYGGVAIPVIEAMAAGVPVVVSKPLFGSNAELSEEAGLVVENTPAAFANAINRVLKDGKLYYGLKKKGLEKFKGIEGGKMERKEASVYAGVLEK